MARDPKGIYRRARNAEASSVPGLQTPYESPEKPEVVVDGDREDPESAARRIVANLFEKGYIRAR
jgi:adenylylsulfate kinase